MKTYVVGTHQKRLSKVLPVSTHNVFFVEKKENIYLANPLIWSYDLLTLVMLKETTMPRPFLIFSQSDYLIQIVDINSHT